MKPVFQGQLKPLYLAIAVSTLSLTLVTAERTQAATVSNQSTIQINIPAGSLSQSLALYTQQTGVQVVAPASVTANKQSSSVSGA